MSHFLNESAAQLLNLYKSNVSTSTFKSLILGIENHFSIQEDGEIDLINLCQTIKSQRYELYGEQKYPEGKQ